MIYQTNRWWIFEYEDKYRKLWEKEHKKQTPMWRKHEIFKNFYSYEYNDGTKIPRIKIREATAADQD